MAANQSEVNGMNLSSAIVDDAYVPPTPAERGDFVDEDEVPAEEPEEELEEAPEEAPEEDEAEEDEAEEDAPEEDAPEEDEAEEEPKEDELEDEDGTEDEVEDEAEVEEPKAVAKGNKKQQVPLDRLNKEIGKRRALEGELKSLRDKVDTMGKPPAVDTPAEADSSLSREDFEGMQEAMLDGETDKAFEIFGKMMTSQSQAARSTSEKEVTERVRNELNQDRAMSELQQTASTLAVQYPELDSAGEGADDGLIEEVVEMRDLYVDRGMTPAEALKRSVRLVALENSLVDRTAKPKADMAKPRKPVNTKAKLAAASKERGKLSGSGGSNGRPDINIGRMSDDEFAGLSAEAKARARGDYVE